MFTREQWNSMWKGRKTAVLGFGISNRPLVRMLAEAEAFVTVYDQHTPEELGESALELQRKGVAFETWNPESDDAVPAEVIFRTPGIRPDCKPILRALEKGARLTSEMETFFDLTEATVIGITGSDGKTTTTTLTYMMLDHALKRRGCGKVYVGGNIGTPLLPLVFEMTSDDFAVVELSSFQLMTMKKSPVRSVLTNVTPNHLNWHTDMDEYIKAKMQICRHRPARRVVVNADNGVTMTLGRNTDLFVSYFSSRRTGWMNIIPEWQDKAVAFYLRKGWICEGGPHMAEKRLIETSDILLPGQHNIENYMAACAVLEDLIGPEDIRAIATTFKGVEHRLELCREKDGVRYYNSSIDSTPTRTKAALSALGGHPIVILGGRDKHLSYNELAPILVDTAKAVVLTGEAMPIIREAIEKVNPAGRLPVYEVPGFDEAVTKACGLAESGDCVLLSPSCTSFDCFKNFEERGRRFKELVNAL